MGCLYNEVDFRQYERQMSDSEPALPHQEGQRSLSAREVMLRNVMPLSKGSDQQQRGLYFVKYPGR